MTDPIFCAEPGCVKAVAGLLRFCQAHAAARVGEKHSQPPRTLEEAETAARFLGQFIGTLTPPGWGFCLIMATFGEGGLSTYLSNCERPDTIKLLREMARKLQKGEAEI